MKILFTHSYFLQFDIKQVAHAQPYPPLGTILAASLIRENDFEVKLFDTMFASSPNEIIPVLESYRPNVLVVYDDGFNYLTKMCLSNMRDAAFKMQHFAKKIGCKVIMTSSDAADHYEKYLNEGADYVIIGEAEYTLLNILNYIKNDISISDNISGIAYKNGGQLVKTDKRVIKKDLDELPLPAWDLVDIEPYKKVWQQKHGFFSINIATTRGCPYKCNWCAKPIYGNIYNMRSVKNVIQEIKLLKQLFNFDHIWFCDDIFGLKDSWVSEFSELVKKENLNFRYKIQSRADLLIQENYVQFLSDSGCDDVWMGAESGSQRILDAMDKGTAVNQIKDARKLLKQHNIKASFFIQFGYLSETIDDIKLTIDLLKETMPDDIGISVSYPLPGTKFYNKVKHDLKNKSNWTDSDELAMMFNSTYKPEFYKQLQQYVHLVYRQQNGLNSLKNVFIKPSKKNFKQSLSLIKNIPLKYSKKNQLTNLESDARSL
jgi:anaerobic magnesium-protoporphyrin IX monomethyl ester cyclase